MKTIEYRTVDKSAWGDGPWQNEPDKIQWMDEETGLPCMIKRNPEIGFWCGYVGVSKGHAAYDKHYDSVSVDVHGGLTYANFCQPGPEEHVICHVVEDGEDDKVWWLGFDCGHYRDLCPYREWARGYGFEGEVYRDQAYVQNECRQLAKQLVNLS